MKITIMGTGYVGLVASACFSEMGNIVYGLDIEYDKIESLKKGLVPIYEPGLEELVLKNQSKGDLIFTNNLKEGLDNSNICFIAVGTPMGEDGSANMQYVLNVARDIGQLVNHNLIVVNKSTVPVGTADKVKATILNELEQRNLKLNIEVVSNPEFLKEGSAVEDFMRPDRVIIGSSNENVIETLKELYAPFTTNHERFITMDVRSAEMTKYAANAMLATRISFMNEIANICEKVGADINNVRKGIGSDKRIGYNFLYAGCGYGGSCFPKDVKALIKIAANKGYDANILKEVEALNNQQKLTLVRKVVDKFGESLSGLTFGIWGLSFKPGTDDMREAPSVVTINKLCELGAKVQVYDPQAMEVAEKYYFEDNKKVKYAKNKYDALDSVHSLLLLTEWKEFRSPDFEEMSKRMVNKIIFDGRNQYNKETLKEFGFEYHQIGNGYEGS
ncbi:UDP-glucose 6-dehydrogenase YwqF [anaerobic digester metagenome]|jgi:UDPglucose 6-dehydrogenase|uniref:UDP-glucose 6-dehydrogenase n=1 Tax=Methanobacterium subterraneum TaxID=59277 RepID=A0A2H4VCK0_9EURY|nr:UDP-glucose/GDP-mannose dehydrogenase family protein [Methanobacterium subterraneum]AUB55817.1 UDP-glucose 6-dehydrogenase [Methanobacterium subterraneum]MBW4258061.1 UDP-glucose/GDP-mannose dehydrogenase family protein [Methanobacterium sp. YSL]